jgi:hypothetical protein
MRSMKMIQKIVNDLKHHTREYTKNYERLQA